MRVFVGFVALTASVLVIGIATANFPMIALAVVVGILVGYRWTRRVGTHNEH